MEGYFNHLINIIFQSMGTEKAINDINKVRQAVNVPWDTKSMSDYENNVRKAFGVSTQGATDTKNAVKGASAGMSDFVNAMRRAVIVAPVWMLIRSVIQGVTSLIQSQIKFMLDMEDAMARIKIVGKGTAEELNNLKTSLVALAYVYGVSASEALNAAQIFAQQGRSVQETFALTRAAMIGSKALGTDIKTTIDNLTAAVEGFKIPVQDSILILDRWVAVEKEFAVTAQDLADATKSSAATAKQLGISMSEFLGDVTAVIEVTRKSGSEAARGLSFLYARMYTTAQKTIETIAKIPFYLDAQGKATNSLTTEMRSASDILGDLALKWNNLTKEERLSIAESLGSKRQMVVVNALMQNYNRSIDARIVSLTAAGNAERAFGIIQDTTRQKLQELGAAWNSLTSALSGSSAFKNLIDSLSIAITAWTRFIDVEQGAKIAVAQRNAALISGVELRQSEIASLQELLKAREKLDKAPATEENTSRIAQVNAALEKISKDFPGIDISLRPGSEKKLARDIEAINDGLMRQKIALSVSVDIVPKNIALVEERRKLQERWGNALNSEFTKSNPQIIAATTRIKEIDAELLANQSKMTEEIQKQYTIYQGQKSAKQILADLGMDDASNSSELTEKEKEKLFIEQQLTLAKAQTNNNVESQIALELDLVKNSKFLYTEHEKNLKLSELENSLLAETISTSEKLVSHEIDLARIRGASARQIFDLEAALKAQLYGENAVVNSLDYQLEKEKLITQEKEAQKNLSSETIQIYKIARAYGEETASNISKLLNYQMQFEDLSTREQSIFKKKFQSQYEQLMASQYFFGKEGSRFSSPGANIPIKERAGTTPYAYTQDAESRIEKQARTIERITHITPTIPIAMDIKIDIDSKKITEQILDKINRELRTKSSSIRKGLDDALENF